MLACCRLICKETFLSFLLISLLKCIFLLLHNNCYRNFLDGSEFTTVAICEGSAIKTNKTLYMICQDASHSAVYKITVLDGRLMSCHDETLTPHCTLETFRCDDAGDFMDQPLAAWHFFSDGRLIYAVPSYIYDGRLIYSGDRHGV